MSGTSLRERILSNWNLHVAHKTLEYYANAPNNVSFYLLFDERFKVEWNFATGSTFELAADGDNPLNRLSKCVENAIYVSEQLREYAEIEYFTDEYPILFNFTHIVQDYKPYLEKVNQLTLPHAYGVELQ